MRWLLGAVVASLVASSAAAEPAQVWQPAGKWEVNFADQQCLAFRPFKRGNDTIQVGLDAYPSNGNLTLYLVVPANRVDRWSHRSVQVGGRAAEAQRLTEFSLGADGLRAVQTSLNAEEVDRLTAGEALEIGESGRSLRTSLAALGTVRTHLKTCVADLMKRWGYTAEQQQMIATFPEPVGGLMAGFFRWEDYPDAAVRSGAAGRVRALVDVGSDGRGKSCRIVLSSRNKDLDTTTCAVLVRRGRYVPAKDSAGTPVEGPVIATIAWVLPDE